MPIDANGEVTVEFLKSLASSVSAWVASLVEEITGILVCLGNNSTVSAMSYDLMLDIYTL